MSSTVKTRVMVISDTHNYQFNNATKCGGKFTLPTPKCDILIHTGDLTINGQVAPYKKAIDMLSQIPAELKLVIAGNHDLDLDPMWQQPTPPKLPYPRITAQYETVLALWKGPLAQDAGVTYLEEGMHTFSLSNGAKFKVYASPYQPEFCNWAFPYWRDEDRFNPVGLKKEGMKNIAVNPIPSFPDVDIVMTHGPPKGILDVTEDSLAPGQGVGCESLLRALGRARPKLACWGHIHEAYGMNLIKWKKDDNEIEIEGEKYLGDAVEKQSSQENAYPAISGTWDIKHGEETLMVNSAIMDLAYRPAHSPWIFDIELPVA